MKNKLVLTILFLFVLASYSQGKQSKKENTPEENISILETRCDSGNLEACEKLYLYCLNRRNYKKEGEYIIKAVKKLKDANRPKYVFMWGIATTEGHYATEPIQQDFLKGMGLIKESADMDFPPAQLMLADFYSISEDSKGLRRAVYYLNCACEAEYEPACKVLSYLGVASERVYNAELREKMWKGFDESGDRFLIRGRYNELRDKMRKEKFILN